jgi:putative tricarboxylic transport membrane protein
MVVLGLLLGLVGQDVNRRAALHPRHPRICRRVEFRRVAVGVFGIAEILRNLENEHDPRGAGDRK